MDKSAYEPLDELGKILTRFAHDALNGVCVNLEDVLRAKDLVNKLKKQVIQVS